MSRRESILQDYAEAFTAGANSTFVFDGIAYNMVAVQEAFCRYVCNAKLRETQPWAFDRAFSAVCSSGRWIIDQMSPWIS